MSKDNKSNSDQFFLFIMSIVLIAAMLHRYGEAIILSFVRHKYLVAAAASMLGMSIWVIIRAKFSTISESNDQKRVLFRRQAADCVCVGQTKSGQTVYVPLSARRMHAQVVGTTNAGKTESVIVPWAVSDIRDGRGLILIDGKSDRSLLDKLHAYCAKYHRAKDFRLLSLVNVDASSTLNPLVGGTPEEITERVFAALSFEDEYYRNQQYEILKHVLILFQTAHITPTFQRLIQVIANPELLLELSQKASDDFVRQWADRFAGLSKDEREKRSSGLVTQLGHFATGDTSKLFNDPSPQIDIEQVIREGLIVYCQLPAMKVPVLGKAAGKMILQAIQSAVSTRHLDETKGFKFFSIYLDDFTEYLTPGFVTLLNKSRSANVGVTFAHQALGDLAGLGEDVRNSIQTNSNLKVFMRTNEPETAEYFSRTLGTKRGVKLTERQRRGALGQEKTGDNSAREVEEFVYHPNLFKRDLGTGDAVMIVPMANRNHAVQLKFHMLPDLLALKLPSIPKSLSRLLDLPTHALPSKREARGPSGAGSDTSALQERIGKALEGAA